MRPAIGFVLLLSACAVTPRQPPVATAGSDAITVRFSNGGVTLVGEVFTPAGPGPFPGVVLIHGSGPDSAGLWPYSQHARSLAADGIAVLVYDKRGVGRSGGAYLESTPFDTLAADAMAALATLRQQPRVDPSRVGVWGRSQGAWIAALVAARDSQLAFAIPIVGGGVTPYEQNLYQREMRLRRTGLPQAQIAETRRVWIALWNYLGTGEGRDSAQGLLDTLFRRPYFLQVRETLAGVPRTGVLPQPAEVRASPMPFIRSLSFDPLPHWRATRLPVLAVLGGSDELTPTWSTAEKLGGVLTNARSRIVVYPGADHLVCPAAPDGQLRRGCPLMEGYERLMSEWILEVTSAR